MDSDDDFIVRPPWNSGPPRSPTPGPSKNLTTVNKRKQNFDEPLGNVPNSAEYFTSTIDTFKGPGIQSHSVLTTMNVPGMDSTWLPFEILNKNQNTKPSTKHKDKFPNDIQHKKSREACKLNHPTESADKSKRPKQMTTSKTLKCKKLPSLMSPNGLNPAQKLPATAGPSAQPDTSTSIGEKYHMSHRKFYAELRDDDF